ncbi:MAG: hypothetical protein IJ416_00050 [Ruminiclostridium sp.]|nr:hypothetical protein [Ruminiclostridium sp.]
MTKTVLLVSELLQDLNRMKEWFPGGWRVKGVNSFSAVPSALRSELPEIVVLRIRGLEDFFHTYEVLRTSMNSAETPLVAISDIGLQSALAKNVELKNTRIVGSSVTDENMMKILAEVLTAAGVEWK